MSKTRKQGFARCLAVGVFSALTSVGLADEGELSRLLDVNLDVAWDSRYVSQGRDNLDGDSLVGTTLDVALPKGLSLGGWYAASPDQDYREFNAFAAWSVQWKDFEAAVSYTRLLLLSDDEDDDEIGAGLAYTALPGDLTLGVDGYYSFEAEGAFFETSLGGEYPVLSRLSLVPAATLGFNAGYVAEGHDGLNDVRLALEAVVSIQEGLDLVGYAAYTWGVNADSVQYPDDEGLDDFAYFGIALRVAR